MTPDLFGNPPEARDDRLYRLMIAALNDPRERSEHQIPEPTLEEKEAFAQAFVRASRPRPFPGEEP